MKVYITCIADIVMYVLAEQSGVRTYTLIFALVLKSQVGI